MYDFAASIGDGSTEQLKTASEESLILAAKCGKHLAYAELCRRRRESVFHTVHRITRNKEDTEDVIQDAYMKAFMHIGAFDGRSAFSTWLTRIAINSALMILRKRKRRIEVSLSDHLENETYKILDIVEPSDDPEERYIRSERDILIRQAIRRLPTSLRAVVEVQQSKEASIQEVAMVMGISVSAAKSRLVRAKIKLREPLRQVRKDASSARVSGQRQNKV
jgi:RNA polymerase sigma factor (sigma-70 family)